jgi:hypothetical protein
MNLQRRVTASKIGDTDKAQGRPDLFTDARRWTSPCAQG